jgi:IS30 family transposase
LCSSGRLSFSTSVGLRGCEGVPSIYTAAQKERQAAEDRAIPGHWEGDLLGGTSNSHIATLVERHSRFTILVKVPSKDTATVVDALTRQVRKLPASLRRSLT